MTTNSAGTAGAPTVGEPLYTEQLLTIECCVCGVQPGEHTPSNRFALIRVGNDHDRQHVVCKQCLNFGGLFTVSELPESKEECGR